MTNHYQPTQHATQANDLPKPRTWTPTPHWNTQSLCQNENTNWWYPDQGNSTTARKAKLICSNCPVRTDCLEHALEHDEKHGIWGGLTDRERRHLRRLRERGAEDQFVWSYSV